MAAHTVQAYGEAFQALLRQARRALEEGEESEAVRRPASVAVVRSVSRGADAHTLTLHSPCAQESPSAQSYAAQFSDAQLALPPGLEKEDEGKLG